MFFYRLEDGTVVDWFEACKRQAEERGISLFDLYWGRTDKAKAVLPDVLTSSDELG